MTGAGERFGEPRPAQQDISPLAIGALISAVLFAPIGVVLGLVAKWQIRRTGQRGDALATAAIAVGVLVLLFLALR